MILFAQELGLIGQGDHNVAGAFLQQALTAQAGVQTGIHGTVDEIFFFLTEFLQVLLALLNIEMAGTAGADTTAVVMQINVVVEGNFEQTLSGCHLRQRTRFQTGLFELKSDFVHRN